MKRKMHRSRLNNPRSNWKQNVLQKKRLLPKNVPINNQQYLLEDQNDRDEERELTRLAEEAQFHRAEEE